MSITRMVVGGLIPLLLAGPALAAKKPELPPWARSIADTAFQSAALALEGMIQSNDHDAVYLLNEQTVRFDGKTASEETTERAAIQILTKQGVRYAQDLAFFFDNQSRIASIQAWTARRDGRIVELPQDKIRTAPRYPGFIFYSDSKVKTFSMPEVAAGDLFLFEVKTVRTHPEWTTGFSGGWDIQKEAPVRESRFTLELPPGWTHRYRIYNMADRPPEDRGGGVFVWTWREVEPYEDVELARPDLIGGFLRYNCLTSDPQWMSRNRATWDDHAAHFARLAWPRLTLNPEIKQTVADLTKTCTTDLEKIRAIANYVRNSLTYVAVEVSVGGYQPHHVQEVFRNKYGDCKDMSALLIGMLREAGIPAYPVLIRTLGQGAVDPEFPVASFNHAIAYVPGVDASEPWVNAWPEQPPFGRGLWIDATGETCSIRDLPWSVQGAYGLVVTPDKGYMIQTPVFGPEQNVETRIGQAALSVNGDMAFEGVETFSGALDMEYKGRLKAGTDQDRLEWIQRRIGASVARCTLGWFRHSPPGDLDTPARLDYQFTAGRYMNTAGNLAFFRPNVLNPWTQNPFPDEERTLPVFLRHPWTEVDSLTFRLPDTYQVDALPPPVTLTADFGRFEASCAVQGDVLTYTRRLTISQREIPPEAYAALQQFFQTVIKTDKTQIVLKRRPTAQRP